MAEIGTAPPRLKATPGDVLLSNEAIPYPGAILEGFRRSKYGPHFQPYLDFGRLTKFLEFLEHVVLCERLIAPVARYQKSTARLIHGKRTWLDFAIFQATGDLDFTTEKLGDILQDAGVLIDAEIHVGDPTSDDVVARLMPSSSFLQSKFAHFLHGTQDIKGYDKFTLAKAHMAARIGTPLHTAEAASIVRVPYILGPKQEHDLRSYEGELLRVRKSVTEILLDKLNCGARKELSKLADLGPISFFPETPIASMIVQNAATPEGLVHAAVQLRAEFSSFRRQMNQIQSELVNEDQSIKVRLKRMRELERLADSLWDGQKTDIRANAMSVSEALFAVPEAAMAPSPASVKELAIKLSALPVDSLLDLYRRRKIRLMLKAKRGFLKSTNSTKKVAKIFDIPEEVALRSRHLKRAPLDPKYAHENPDFAASWYGGSSAAT